MAENPYKNPPDNPITCPCCQAAAHWQSVYDKGVNAGGTLAFLLSGVLILGLLGVIAKLSFDCGLLVPPKWNVTRSLP